jgi:hypothetical protein
VVSVQWCKTPFLPDRQGNTKNYIL